MDVHEIINKVAGGWEKSLVEKLGRMVEIKGEEILLEVEPQQVTSVASYLFGNFSIKDISISNPPLEKIIESIYQEPLSS